MNKVKTSGRQTEENCVTRNIVIGDRKDVKAIFCKFKNFFFAEYGEKKDEWNVKMKGLEDKLDDDFFIYCIDITLTHILTNGDRISVEAFLYNQVCNFLFNYFSQQIMIQGKTFSKNSTLTIDEKHEVSKKYQ
jgi:hypothetical protein